MGDRSVNVAQSLPAQVNQPHTWPKFLPTARAIDGRSAGPGTSDAALLRRAAKGQQNLSEQIQITERGLWPTPTTQDASNNGGPSQHERNSKPLNAEVGGSLNPTWVEWLMGFPEGWTDLKD